MAFGKTVPTGGQMFSMELHGFKELDALLRDLPEKVSREIAADAVRAGAKVIQAEAKRLAPRRTGRLASQIKVRMSRMGSAVTASIGVRTKRQKGLAWYAGLMEFGVKRHTILLTKKSGKGGRKVRSDRQARKGVMVDPSTGIKYGTKVEHPGVRARPFLRPALERKKAEAIRAMGQALRAGIEAEATSGKYSHRAFKKHLRSGLSAVRRARRIIAEQGGGE